MSPTAKVLLVAGILIVLGAILAGCGLFGIDGNWNWIKGESKMITAQDTITGDFTNIEINVISLDVELLPSDDDTCYYVEKTWDKLFSNHKVENGTLTIGQDDNRQWYDHIGIYNGNASMKLYLPKDAYDNLTFTGRTSNLNVPTNFHFQNVTATNSTGDIAFTAQVDGDILMTCSTGKIRLQGTTSQAITASVSTGAVDIQNVAVAQELSVTSSTGHKVLTDVTCGTLRMKATTGDTELTNVVVFGDAMLESGTGDWSFDGFDAANIALRASTGDVKGTLRSEKIFFVDTDTGHVDVPKCTTGGTCDITTDTGDIDIEIVP